MADILIRGWDVPKGCESCQLNADGRGCTITGTQYEGDTWVMMDFDEHAERLPDCPLVELQEHGDLVCRSSICKQPAPMGYGKAYVKTRFCPNCGAKMEVSEDA